MSKTRPASARGRGDQVDIQEPANPDVVRCKALPCDNLQSRIHDLEVVADWREDLAARIARETLIYEFADCTRSESFNALEAEVALFNQVCLAITAPTPEGEAA